MRATFLALLFALLTSFAAADEIDMLVTNLPDGWDNGMNSIINLPESASVTQVLGAAFQVWWIDNTHITNYTLLTSRQVAIPRAHFPGAYTDSYTAAFVQTSHGKKIVLFRYGGDGWWSRIFPFPPDLSPIVGGDPILNWLNFPARRDPRLHLALVDVVSISNEHHTYTEATNSKVSDDGGKTWYNLLYVWSATATIKVVESPGVEMPATLMVPFERFHYVHTRDEKWTDWLVKPDAKLLAFFSDKGGKWSLSGSFLDPVGYISMPGYGGRLQALFKTPLANEKTLRDRKKVYDEASKKAQRCAATNHIDEK
jgi:hypothetical protein